MKNENEQLQFKINELDNLTRMKSLEIHNIPQVQNEKTCRVAVNILKMVEPSITEADIEDCYRLRRLTEREENGKTSHPILVKFFSRQKRTKCLINRKLLSNINFHEVGINTTKVYLNENLTPITKSLFYKANTLKKTTGWKFIWTKNGIIKVRKSNDSPVVVIKNELDLTKIVK